MPQEEPDPIKEAFKKEFELASQAQQPDGQMPFGLPGVMFIAGPPPAMTQQPFTRATAERIWDKVQSNSRVSASTLTTFAACTGFMPTLQASKELTNKYGVGFMPESWNLEEAADRLGKHDFADFVHRPPEVLPRSFAGCVSGDSPVVAPCPVCGIFFEPGDMVRSLPVLVYAARGCEEDGIPPNEQRIAAVIFHAHHLFEDESQYVPLPTPAQARAEKARRAIHERMKREWRYWPIYKLGHLFERILEYGANRGWWAVTSHQSIP